MSASGPASARPSAVHTARGAPQAGRSASASVTAPSPSGVIHSVQRRVDSDEKSAGPASSIQPPVTVNSASRTVRQRSPAGSSLKVSVTSISRSPSCTAGAPENDAVSGGGPVPAVRSAPPCASAASSPPVLTMRPPFSASAFSATVTALTAPSPAASV